MENALTQITNYLLTQSWQIAVLAVVIAAASLTVKNKSAHIRYLLWLVLLAKCLVPPLLTIPLAILPQSRQAELIPVSAAQVPVVTVEAVDMALAEPRTPLAPVATPRALTITERLAEITTREWLAFAWIIGVTVFVLIVVIKALRVNRWLSSQRRPLPAELQTEIENLLTDLGIRISPKVWLVDGIGQPFVWGLLRGSIYLPANFAGNDSVENRREVLGHELSHILRFDAAVNLLQIIAQAIFWFHPFVWWANKKIRAEREKCCDEMAIASLGTKAKDYTTAIVDILVAEYKSTQPVPSLAVAGPVKNIEERIKTIMKPGKKFYKGPSIIAAIAILALALVAVPTTLALTARTKKEPAESITLLGMQVVDVTPETQRLYDLHHPYGVLILNPGPDHARLDIGELSEGYYFWIVGHKTIHNVQEMIAEMLRIQAKPRPIEGGLILEGHNGFIRVVYGMRNGTNTQYLKLTDKDIAELRRVGKKLGMPDDKLYESVVTRSSKEEQEIKDRLESAKKLSALGKALFIYASDHEEKYPDNLRELQKYVDTFEKRPNLNDKDFERLLENVEYLGKGKTAVDPPDELLAYDKELLKHGDGTNVLFNDGHVKLLPRDELFKRMLGQEKFEKMQKRVESAKKLSGLGKALLIYANNNEEKYPNTLYELQKYVNEKDLEWLLENVEYLGKRKTVVEPPNTPIAYDKTLLKKGEGTNVLFNDAHVAFERPKQLEKLGIVPENNKAIQIEARFILVPVDANEIKDFFEKEKLEFTPIKGEPNLTNYVLNAEQVHRFLKLTHDIPGSKVLTAPQVTVLDGEEAALRTQRTIKYEYTNPNAISEQPEQKELRIGTIFQVKPTLQADGEKILLELELEHSNLLGFEDGLPQTEIAKIKTRVLIPNGQTLFISGQKITSEEQDGQIVEKALLILVKAEEVEPKNAQVE